MLFSSASFTKKGLLPTDSPAFSDQKGSFCVDIKYFQCPPGWEFISDWMLDLNGQVDEQGWYISNAGDLMELYYNKEALLTRN